MISRRAVAAVLAAAALLVVPPARAQSVEVRTDVEYGVANGKRLLLDAYVPPERAGGGRRPAVILIHGGGFRAGDKQSFEPEARKLATRGWVAFSVNYRLDEPVAFPAEVEDVQAAVRWVRSHADEFRVDADRIGALGESAGGHLAAMLATVGNGSQTRDARIRVGVAWSGPMDLVALARERGDSWGVPLLGCPVNACEDRYAQASPITHIDKTDSPLFVINSTAELVPVSQAQSMGTRMEDEGQPLQLRLIEGNRHALDYREEVWNSTELWLEKHLQPPEGRSTAGTAVFVLTGLVVVAGVVVLVTRRRRAEVAGRAH